MCQIVCTYMYISQVYLKWVGSLGSRSGVEGRVRCGFALGLVILLPSNGILLVRLLLPSPPFRTRLLLAFRITEEFFSFILLSACGESTSNIAMATYKVPPPQS